MRCWMICAPAGATGLSAAGYFTYEAGLALEPRLRPLLADMPPMRLAWFGLFDGHDVMTPDEAEAWLAAEAPQSPAWLGPAQPAMTQADYTSRFHDVHRAIHSGDIYQANLTFQNRAAISGPSAVACTGRCAADRQRAMAG